MDDILILAPTRWQLRGAVKVVNQTLWALNLEKHPNTLSTSSAFSIPAISRAITTMARIAGAVLAARGERRACIPGVLTNS
jgi:hypothetical protein